MEERRGDRAIELLSLTSVGRLVPRSQVGNRQQPAESNLPRYLVVDSGDLVVNPMWLTGGSIAVSTLRGAVSPDYRVFRPRPEVNPRYLHHLLRSDPYFEQYRLYARADTTFDRRVQQEDLDELPLALPPLEEQRRIAGFLDDQVPRIDAMTGEVDRRRDALAARLESQLESLLTGGVDGSRLATWSPFGQLPNSWIECRLRSIPCEVQTGPFGSQLHSEDYVTDGWPVVNPANLVAGRIIATEGTSVDDATRARLQRHVLVAGDVVFGRRGELGRAGLVKDEQVGWLCGTGSLRVRLKGDRLSPEFLVRLLRTRALRFFFNQQAVGSTMANLNTGILMAMPLLVPPLEVQRALVSEARALEEKHSAAIRLCLGQSALLQERKRALITAAVTGEFDVSSAGPRATVAVTA